MTLYILQLVQFHVVLTFRVVKTRVFLSFVLRITTMCSSMSRAISIEMLLSLFFILLFHRLSALALVVFDVECAHMW